MNFLLDLLFSNCSSVFCETEFSEVVFEDGAAQFPEVGAVHGVIEGGFLAGEGLQFHLEGTEVQLVYFIHGEVVHPGQGWGVVGTVGVLAVAIAEFIV